MESENLEHTAVEGNPPDDKERERVEKDTKFVLSQSETDQQEGLSESAEGDPSNVPTGKEADQITEEKDDPTESEKCETNPALSEDKVPPELTLVILGDPVAVEPGPNLFLGPDKENEPFSFVLYDLCGRVFVVYDLLKNTDHFPSDKDVSAFLLLLPHGHHVSQYESSVQWLKSSFGEGALDYLMTIVTHESNKQSEGAMEDLKECSSFSAQRFHVCSKKCLKDEKEILSLLEKIDVMVLENDPKCYSRTQKEEPEPAQGGPGPDQGETGPTPVSEQGGPEQERPGPELLPPNSEGLRHTMKPDGDDRVIVDTRGSRRNSESQPSTDGQTKENNRMGATIKSQSDALLRRLNLQNRLENKLTTAEFLQIHPALKHDQHICESELISVYLYKLLMLDYRARYAEAKQEPADESNFIQQQNNEEEDDDSFFIKKVDSAAQSQHSNIHPLDLQMAVFHCSDDFLKQKIVTKLSQCQYALPLLVPDPFTENIECPLWTFREIKKTWKKTETKDNLKVVTMKSMPIYKAETPMVFCFRLGSLSVSKSQLINTLINDRHSTFFHRNCPGSTKSRLLFDGVVEIAWYCPAGRSSDTFTDCVAFCNLHGDGLIYDKQLKIMMDKASVNVVFVPTLKKDPVISDLLKSPKPLIVLIGDDGDGVQQIKKNKYRVGLKERSLSDVSKELKIIISDTLSTDLLFQLELSSESMSNKTIGIRIDENNISCRGGFSAAVDVTKTIETTEVSRIKNTFLPCQGEMWHKWGKLNKEQYRLKGNIEKEKGKKQIEMRKLREDQSKAACSPLVKSFIKHLSSLPSTEREYFLKWTQILMDAHATDCLSSILQSYNQVWSEVLDLKKKPDKSKDLQYKQADLAKISKNLQSATCGLEHIFREMCQIYEAHKSLKKQPKNEQTDWSKYPELAAELMISGHPMELMDGDAGQVPITWISSLIEKVILKLGDQRVFVLSVLGIQSSGKSTMLNAMFGLEFAVSAGRCTRGAFMQLVKLSEEMRKGFQWDYILVVDTEGLRALELEGNETLHHDNELATFVVGVGNMTLVNIFGENPSEMQDVLQIVVQAFMRMKEVKLSPSCVFVHQNVTDVGAAEKNMDGKRKLQDKLDQMVQLAAKEEVCYAESFSDIIEFDVQKDVKYFAQLWEGSPPMAPPNPGYSESVQELKNYILSKAANSSGIKLSEFKTKVKDLWNALLNENFVFSFRNTLEIAVYRKLEVQYSNWTWSLRQEMLKIEEHLYTRIENGEFDQVNNNYLQKRIETKYNEIREDFLKYFDADKDKEMLVQWRGSFELKIKDFHDELVQGLLRKLNDVIEQKKTGKRLDEKKTMFENSLLQKSKELAHKLKDKAKDEDELKKQFSSVWQGWVTELTQGTKPIDHHIIIANDVYSVLQQLGMEMSLIHKSQSSKAYKQVSVSGDYSQYVGERHQKLKKQKMETDKKESSVFSTVADLGKKIINFLSGPLPQEEQLKIRDHILAVEKEALELIKNKPVATRGYSSSYLYEVAAHVITRVGDFESKWKYSLKKEFTVDLILYVFDRAEGWILQSHTQYIKNTDARTYLESKRNEYYSVFRSFCRGSSSAVVLAEVICEKLKASMTEFVQNRTAIDIAGHMRESHPGLNENRLNLEKHVLKALAEKEDFRSYICYIYEPKRYIESFIQEKVHKYIMEEENVPLLMEKNVESIERFVIEALYRATEKVQEGDVTLWLQEFDKLIKEKLTAVSVSSQNFSDVNRFDFLKDAIEKGLVPIVQDLKHLPLTEINEARMKPGQMLIDQFCNCCWETCPFCSAVCTNTVKDHSPDKHSVPYHRPSGITGLHTRGTLNLVIDFCTTLVASERSFYPDSSSDKSVPYKQYQTAGGKFAEWQITPSGSMLVYWKWFVCRFQKQLEDHHKRKFQGQGEIPSEWRNYSKEEAIDSLEEMYNM